MPLKSIQDIKHCLYINLESRKDRRLHVECELTKIGIGRDIFDRFNAIQLPKKSGSGAIGCSMSHLKCLELARKNKWEHVLIVEDDIEFTDPSLFVQNFNLFLEGKQGKFDVCLIAGNNFPPFIQKEEYCVKVSKCQTTTGYFVLAHYYDRLIENIRYGINQLIKDPEERIGLRYTQYQLKYSIDKWWFQLQEKDNWYLITPLTVTQRDDYSDIEERNTSYSSIMLDLEKHQFMKKYYKVSPSTT